jgi:amino acid adenylation domain-containing protein
VTTLDHYLTTAAKTHPGATAVRFKDESITYRELDDLSDALAATLAEAGVGHGDRVGLWLTKSIEAVVAMYAALKLGAAYVPVDPMAPPKRAAYILADCQVRALVTTQDHYALLDQDLAVVVLADQDSAPAPALGWSEAVAKAAVPTPPAGPDDLAYILYTSGSTGSPKGVMLSHRNGRVFVDWAVEMFGITSHDRMANHAPFHFDLSVLDIFAAAAASACLVIVPENRQSLGHALNQLIFDEDITVWYSVPNVLIRMLGAGNVNMLSASNLRVVLFAGEVFPVKHLRALRDTVPSADLYNLYGPTETNVCTFYQVGEIEPGRTQPVPIGRGCDYATTVLLDESGAVTGTEGELCVGGDSVMLGYWGDPGKTRQRMTGDLYRTGDIVRRDEHGDLLFLGRRDHMVKIRGNRIELGEVEAVLLGHADVSQAAVVAVPGDGEALRLEACVIGHVAESALRRHCLAILPRYMVPERIHVLESLPMTSTGKIDRPALTALLEP